MLAEPAPLGRRGDYASDVATVRVVLVDSDGDGLSHVGSVIERTGAPAVEDLHEIFNGPLRFTMPKGCEEEFLDMSPGFGAAMWRVFEFSPGLVYDMHQTATLDFDVVIDGSITLGLDRQEVLLGPGDGVLLRGDRHSWRAGAQGCRMLIALIGAENSPGRGHRPDRP
jgi:quercetin dioxygenase-like cupin family protein